MKKQNLLLALLVCIALGTNAQKGITYTIHLSNPTSIAQNVNAMAKSETAYWTNLLKLDSSMSAKLLNNNYSLYQQYVVIMKTFNYTMEKILLSEQYNFKVRRSRFMKTFLSQKDLTLYEKTVDQFYKKQMASYKKASDSKEINGLRKQAAGWNVLGHRIKFK